MLKPSEFVEAYSAAGAVKSRRSAVQLFLMAVLAGLILGAAGAAASSASYAVENASLAKLISGALFPFGLIIIIYTGSELFTGNCLISISVLDKKASLAGMLRNLVTVYLGNFVGCALVAGGCVYSGSISGALAVSLIKTAVKKCSLDFFRAFVLGFLCNMLVCLGVVCAVTAKAAAGKAIGAYLPVCIFVICGFEHSIANMFYIPAGLFAAMAGDNLSLAAAAGIDTAAMTWGNFLIKNLIPVTLGNIAGGAGLGAVLWYCAGGRSAGK